MSVKSGFFNSINHDRQYDAEDVASIFDGAFADGVFVYVNINGSLEGNQRFAVTPNNGMSVNVGTGKAWFNHTYTLNDDVMTFTLPDAEGALNRYDAIILEVNTNDDVRENSIRVISGTPAASPAKPSLVKGAGIYQYALAYIYVGMGTTSITAANIENVVGSVETPYATGLIPMSSDLPFSFGIDTNGRYGYKEVGQTNVKAFTPFDFGIDGDGNYGYIKRGADSVTPFKTGDQVVPVTIRKVATVTANTTINISTMSGFTDESADGRAVWENLTTNNFFCKINSIRATKTSNRDTSGDNGVHGDYNQYYPGTSIYWNATTGPLDLSISPRLSYNQSQGKLSVSGMNGSGASWARCIVTANHGGYITSDARRWLNHDQTKYDTTTLTVSIDVYACY